MTPTGKFDREWGIELLWASTENYSGKILVFPKAGATLPLSLHKEKSKTWFINGGKFKITYVDSTTKEVKEAILESGQTCNFAPASAHAVEALEDNSMILEVGTADNDNDTFKVNLNADQTKPSEL